jgi:hypothetical protein
VPYFRKEESSAETLRFRLETAGKSLPNGGICHQQSVRFLDGK